MLEQVLKIGRGWDSKASYVQNNQAYGAQNLLRVTPHAGRKPYSSMFDYGIYFPDLAQCLRFKKHPYPQVSGYVLKDSAIDHAVKKAAEDIFKDHKIKEYKISDNLKEYNIEDEPSAEDVETSLYQKIIKNQKKRKNRLLLEMSSKLSDVVLRLAAWVLYKLFPCFLSGIISHTKQIEMLKKAAEKTPGVPLIFLPLHRSHLDYIMVTFILVNYDIRAPLVAAGNNLQIPFFGGLLRGLGAFFIKRRMDPVEGRKDTLYRAILHLYLQNALKLGHNIEFFIEGGRTRTGKPCMPKNGVLSVIVNAFMDGIIKDALLVPVSVNYERLIDGNFIAEQLGQKKKPETFRSAISGIWKTLTSNYGMMRIDFNEPYSIRELVTSFNKIAREDGTNLVYTPNEKKLRHMQSTSSLYGTDVVKEEHRTLVDSISRQVVFDCAAATSVMSTNAIAFLLLTRFRNGVSEQHLAEELDNLRDSLQGKRDLCFSGKSLHIIKYACDLLGEDMVSCTYKDSEVFIKPKIDIPNVIELAYYSNAVVPHFALQSIVMVAAYNSLVNQPKHTKISRTRLIEICKDHCSILRYEFILSKPTQNLDQILDDVIDDFIQREILCSTKTQIESESTANTLRLANAIAADLDDAYSDEESIYNYNFEDLEISLSESKNEDQNALMSVLAPFSYSYLAVAKNLELIYKKESILEPEFIKHVIKDLTNKYENGECPYGESISTESIKNCLKLFEKNSIVELSAINGIRLLSLNDVSNSLEAINGCIEQIERCVPKISNNNIEKNV
ncbi:glycerol-3-phosphate acyltransferase 1, mitochondrial isoform X2 [Condylostylus longicornis]|uniref:glycerol-3-phosphate acyltransferase 1, mitochondrial isoform X2 n=1 Tax=Condylostylus longicornis TaxID=2530218 RepID=UPI00244E3846|nr:glycerol-3-phosphate acyltransferase 1, mitochondrial isoform X2 [Condylostylus longicornis]